MDTRIERIQYLTKKAQRGVIAPSEQNELAQLLGCEPQEFQDSKGLSVLIGIALVAIVLALITSLVNGSKK
ncbi:MAG: hypothetical protein ABH886_04485 [Candidatus Desantisbacteria bacterium]